MILVRIRFCNVIITFKIKRHNLSFSSSIISFKIKSVTTVAAFKETKKKRYGNNSIEVIYTLYIDML